MRLERRTIAVAAGLGLGLVIGAGMQQTAVARRGGSKLRVVSVSVEGATQVALNQVIEIRFNARVKRSSLTNGSISIRPHDRQTGELGTRRPGTLERRGNTVRFVPTLPTHLRDPAAAGDFFAAGAPEDDAFENGTFRPGTHYVVRVTGRGDGTPASSGARGKLRDTVTSEFRTADGSTSDPVFVLEPYLRSPPPVVVFTNPPDRVAHAGQKYASLGGTPGVPLDARVTVFTSGIPLDPTALRAPGAVELLLVAGDAAGETPTPVDGDVLVEQDRSATTLVFRPSASMAPESTYVLRIDRDVTDLTGVYSFRDQQPRYRLREIVEFMQAIRRVDIGLPPEQLPDPPADLTFDWPSDQDERGVLKRNVLELGDTSPWEHDPRVFAVFTTGPVPQIEDPDLTVEIGEAPRRVPFSKITRITTPLGAQGMAGSDWGGNVVIPFSLSEPLSRTASVEAQWAWDANGNGMIDEHEFREMTVDLRDGRNVGDVEKQTSRPGIEYETAPGEGRSNAIVWRSAVDAPGLVVVPSLTVTTPQGRPIADPNNPGLFLVTEGPGGIVVRMRTAKSRKRASAWVHTTPFTLDNGAVPRVEIDAVTPGIPTLIDWTGFDENGEDDNGNGVLDPLNGEDRNGNGVLDDALIAASFDYAVLQPADDPESMTDDELDALSWLPCTRDVRTGDRDDRLSASAAGLSYTFAWDVVADGVSPGSRVIVRGRPFDESAHIGAWMVHPEPVTIDN
jgi:hypothetical protein